MTTQLIAVKEDALKSLIAEVRELKEEVRAARIKPEPQWIPINEYATRVGRSPITINRWIAQGRLEAKHEGAVRLVRVNQAA